MQIVLPKILAENTPALAADVMADLDAIKAVVNGNLGADNFASGGPYLPVGAILEWGDVAAPTGFLLLEGQAVSRATYAALWALWGTRFGAGDGVTTFNMPDCRGRTTIHPDGAAGRIGTEPDALASVGGAERVTPSAGESGVAAHSHGHTLGLAIDGSGSLPLRAPGYNPGALQITGGTVADGGSLVAAKAMNYPFESGGYGLVADSHTHTGAVTGGVSNHGGAPAGASHNNMPPFIALNKIVKV